MFVREPDGTRDQSEAPPSLREGLRSAPAWLLAYIFFIFGFGSGALLNFTPAYCQTELGLSLAQANLYTSLLTVGMIGSSIIMGALLNRLKNRRPLLLVAMFLITVIFAFMFSYNAAQALLFMFAGGFIVQMLPSVVFTLAPEAAASPDTAAVAIAIIVLGQTFGGIGPSICGSVIENYGWHAAAVLLTLLSLSGIAATFLYLRTGKRQIAASNNLE
jgi:fucose permease